jgi:tRNA modification GTPase
VLRISGPDAATALTMLAGRLPAPRRASLRPIRDAQGAELDRAVVLWFPGPATATGEDVAEIHAHGGRAVVRAIEATLAALPGLRRAEAGEFTRRAVINGRMDLAEAEGLADLLAAETEAQRRHAHARSTGALSQAVEGWQAELLGISAQVEALLDFSDEDDVGAEQAATEAIGARVSALAQTMAEALAVPPAERLRDGILVVIAGPPNAGKSTLLNALAQREAAIVSPVAGTTRDVIEVPLAIDGLALRFADTAGLRGSTDDAVEAIGIARAEAQVAASDLLLWLGDPADAPDHPRLCRVRAKADLQAGAPFESEADVTVSAMTGEGMAQLRQWIITQARTLLPGEGEVALDERHRLLLADARDALRTDWQGDLLLLAEQLRMARVAIDRITGRAGTEAMFDALFGRFCIGK